MVVLLCRMELESKLLDGPRAGYCSSSEDEDDSGFKVVNDEDEHQVLSIYLPFSILFRRM